MATKAAVEDKGKEKAPETQPLAAKVHWNTQNLKSSYANFCNATS